ncbi:hypothetical protein ANCDUO_06314 [Ancylostoma duodenale]|uniref:Uncharacterized protein n=1 Tax=Ancylostoma duodenale TaxID=51022 RepID=A0A0C2GWH0_9BILA|nr:hypothetical protein ANCDUO_06314 [Ancylostoma duodenale]
MNIDSFEHLTTRIGRLTQRNVKRSTVRQPTRWSDFFTKSFKERYIAHRVPERERIPWTTLARERDKWRDCWRPLGTSEDERVHPFEQVTLSSGYNLSLSVVRFREVELNR